MSADLLPLGEFKALTKRGLTEETVRKFGYTSGKDKGVSVQIAPYYNAEGQMVAQKVRTPDKEFYVRGSMKEAGLFGQNLWSQGGRKVVITEGEIDAMSVSQIQNHKWPVCSLPSGAQSARKALAKALPWLLTFEEVILMFDMDEAGQAAVEDSVTLFPAGKCKIASLPLKDASEMLQAKRGEEVIQAIWNARVYRPDGILTFKQIKEKAKEKVPEGYPWFSPQLTALTHGRRRGETYFLGGGTGCGKTDFLTQQVMFDTTNGYGKSALFFLEQNPVETGKRVAGKFARKKFHLTEEEGGYTEAELDAALDVLDNDSLFFYDNFGSCDWDQIESRMRFLVHTEGVTFLYLDHLTALAAGADDERKMLEDVTAKIAMLAKELNIVLVVVSHLATPDGKPHEEGGRVMVRHFKGSRAIGYWAHYMFGLERDTQAEDLMIRSTTTFRILKARHDGSKVGSCVYFGYDNDEGLLFETEKPEDSKAHGFKDESSSDF